MYILELHFPDKPVLFWSGRDWTTIEQNAFRYKSIKSANKKKYKDGRGCWSYFSVIKVSK